VDYQKDVYAMEDLDFNNRLVFTSKEAKSGCKPKEEQIAVCKCYRFAHRKKQMKGGCAEQHGNGVRAEDGQQVDTLLTFLRECGLAGHVGSFTEHFGDLDGLLEALTNDGSFEPIGKFLRSEEMGLKYIETSRLQSAFKDRGQLP
jgi:hypothetical protein